MLFLPSFLSYLSAARASDMHHSHTSQLLSVSPLIFLLY